MTGYERSTDMTDATREHAPDDRNDDGMAFWLGVRNAFAFSVPLWALIAILFWWVRL